MPWKSDKQRRWGNSPTGIAAIGKAKVEEFNEATKRKRKIRRKVIGAKHDDR